MNGRHYQTVLCKDGVARKAQHAAAECAHLALHQTFTAYGKEIFKYLGRLLAHNNNGTQAVKGNFKKVHSVWGRLSHTIRAENAPPVCAAYSTKQPCNQYYCLEARHGTCHQRV